MMNSHGFYQAKKTVSIAKNSHEQKRLILCNLKELYCEFKTRHPNLKIGFSKFCSLRPKWCVSAGSAGTHSVCVCTSHQNTQLLIDAANVDKTYKEFMGMMVCNLDDRICMIHRCKDCPGTEPVRRYLCDVFAEIDEDISFKQWKGTDRAMLETHTADVEEFVGLVVEAISDLTAHSYIARNQARYVKERKENLDDKSCIILLDFAENYQFVVQDEIQGFHWNKIGCTLHPVVVYYKEDGSLKSKSLCMLSDDMEHDTCFVHQVQVETANFIKEKLPLVENMLYFSDGCAGQYKNYKNFVNLCHHESDFGIKAEWGFFATSHGKSPCDGIGGTVKRITAKASLQRPTNDQILSTDKMFQFCEEKIPGVHFRKIEKEQMIAVREKLIKRFENGQTVPGTRSYHHYIPLSEREIAYKITSHEPGIYGKFRFGDASMNDMLKNASKLRVMEFVACMYGENWWIGLVEEVDQEKRDIKVRFMMPHGPRHTFSWPIREDYCFVAFDKVLTKIQPPNLATESGRNYTICEEDFCKIVRLQEIMISNN